MVLKSLPNWETRLQHCLLTFCEDKSNGTVIDNMLSALKYAVEELSRYSPKKQPLTGNIFMIESSSKYSTKTEDTSKNVSIP